MRRARFLALLAGTLACGPAALGADPVDYTVKFLPSGDPALDSLLKQTSSLVSLQKKLKPAPFALIGRARADAGEFTTVLHSMGYDSGAVAITINGEALDDPALLDQLARMPAAQKANVLIRPARGQLYRIGAVNLPGLPAHFNPPATVKPGEVALATPILAASASLRTALQNAGYAFAQVSPPLALAVPATHKLDLTYTVTSGPRVDIGAISFSGLERLNADFLRRHIALKPGQRYSDTAIASARDSLLGLGVFTSVQPEPQEQALADGRVPILFRTVMQKRHAVTASIAYATDTGFTLGLSWEDRNVFERAETLTLTAAANGLGGTGTTSPGYDLKAAFSKPDYVARGQTLNLSVEGLQESLTAYDRTALILTADLSRPVTAHTAITYGPAFVTESVRQEGVSRNYVLLQLPIIFTYDTADSALAPTHGVNASLSLTPTEPVVGSRHVFLIAFGQASTYLPVERDARGIIAIHGEVGSIQGATQFQVPPDQRFYAGGSGTVRGYTYQTIGPLFPDDTPEGGLAVDTASLEFRQRVYGHFGIVPFVDVGQVSAGGAPFQGILRVGMGLGARYYTGIGPIRLDVALPLTRVAGSGAFALYVGLGEAF